MARISINPKRHRYSGSVLYTQITIVQELPLQTREKAIAIDLCLATTNVRLLYCKPPVHW
jgi:hypothetical protein